MPTADEPFGDLAAQREPVVGVEQLAADVEAATSVPPETVEWSRPWMGKFLETLRVVPNITAAAREAGIVRQTAQYARKRDPVFDAAWSAVIEESLDNLERFAHTMASTGLEQMETRTTTKQQLVNGTMVVVEVNTVETRSRLLSPQMAIFLLSAHRPEKYRRPQKFEHSGPDDGPIVVAPLADIDQQIMLLSAELTARARVAGGGLPEPVPDEDSREPE